MPDDATLRDVTVEPNLPPAKVDEPAATTAAAVIDPNDKEALEIGRVMLESGYSKDKINDVMQAPQALNSLRYLINNNPQEFLNLLERTDPATGEKFLENMADTYVKRYSPRGTPAAGKDGKGDDNQALMSEVAALREELNGVKTAEQQRQNASALAQIKSRYEARVDDLFGQLPKELGLNKAETRALRAQLNEELGSDPTVVQRVSNGNFVDVPHKFKSIVDNWSGERTASATAAETAREHAANASFPDFSNGAQPFSVDVPESATVSWDATEDAFAKALTNAR